MESKLVGPIAGAVVLALCAPVASASVVEFTDLTAFDAAVAGASTYNFEGIAPPLGGALPGNFTVGGVLFTGGANEGIVYDGNGVFASYGASFFSGQSGSGDPFLDPGQVLATLSGATAIGFTYGDYADSAIPFTVTLSTGDIFSLTTPFNAGHDTGFVGFTSTTPITSVAFLDSGGLAFDVTQFVLPSSPTSVPEPATLSLFGLGLAGVAFMRRRKKAESI